MGWNSISTAVRRTTSCGGPPAFDQPSTATFGLTHWPFPEQQSWQFSLPDAGQGYEAAWPKLFSRDGFAAPFGPTTVKRNDPMFLLKTSCCWWSGQSWPYATSQTLKALADLLQGYPQSFVTAADHLLGP